MRLPRRTRRDLADRLRPYVPLTVPNEPMVDADPIRMFLFRWMIETGDPIDVVARGFDIDEVVASAILSRHCRRLTSSEAEIIATRLGCEAT